MQSEHHSIKTILRKLIPGFVLGFIVLIFLAFLSDWRHVGAFMERFAWKYFAAALLFTLFNYLLRGIKWHFYLRQIGAGQITFRESMRLFVAGFPLAFSPGKVAEIFKAIWVNQTTNIPVAKGVAVVLAERISDGLAVLLLSTLGVIAYPQYWAVFTIILLALLAIIVLTQIRPVAYGLLDFCARIPYVKKFTAILREFYDGSFVLFRPAATLFAVALGMVSWFGEGVGFYLILLGLGYTPGVELFSLAVFALSFSTVVGAISTLPGGLGAVEVSIAGMLLLSDQFVSTDASAATLLIRLATLWFGMSLGLISWIFNRDLLGMAEKYETNLES